MEKSVHQFVTKAFRFFRKAKKEIIYFLKGMLVIFLFLTTYSSHLNPKAVKKHPFLFVIHDMLISFGFLFGFFCFLYAGGNIENSNYIGLTEIITSLLWVGIGSGIFIVLGTINDIWHK